MEVCEKYAKSENADPSISGDLWIQALTYFRDLPSPNCEIFLSKALAIIGGEKDKSKDKRDEVISPLLVLEILQSRPNLKFSVIKNYLINRLEV